MKVELTDVCGELVNVNELETVMKEMLTNMTIKLKKKLLRNFSGTSSPSLEEGRQHSGEQLPARSEAAQFGSEEAKS
ncbi:Guanine nucleotide exchange factor [Trichinella spiralis]|uniref:Guanine nucleotide exchange factor n=1 Tax=Trichinella spiralis TaxID=6334 RepID=A0ABR3K3V4_TRISP